MDEFIYFNELYDIYGELLTETQRRYFEDYYFNNLSFSEMAENYNVSRNAVFKQIHIVMDKLKGYEDIMHLKIKKEKLLNVIAKAPKNIRDEIEEIL